MDLIIDSDKNKTLYFLIYSSTVLYNNEKSSMVRVLASVVSSIKAETKVVVEY